MKKNVHDDYCSCRENSVIRVAYRQAYTKSIHVGVWDLPVMYKLTIGLPWHIVQKALC